MIIKHREKPIKIEGYEALLRRMSLQHPMRNTISDVLKGAQAGIGGEERLDEMLEFFDPPYPHLFIHDLSLPEKIQIDTLLITQSFLMILEVKNMSGKLRLTTNPSGLHQTLANGQEKTYKSPVVQAETAKIKMEKVLKRFSYPLKIETAIVLAYPSQTMEGVPPGVNVWKADEVMVQLHRFQSTEPLITLEQMNAIGQLLLSMHQPYQPFPLAPKFNIAFHEIESGVFCEQCRVKKMNKINRRWHCKTCNFFSGNAHLMALDEWFMIYKSTITAKECMNFLGLRDSDTARRILKNVDLEESGSRCFRTYQPKENLKRQ
ncbi:Nuclease-related domain protein [Planococcus massiliensis]|uniref:Nuclease-related domain protein n=1 Tax=Planococcus massiliensis TaxID=1499687 RepID=A0A098EI48_9BACL|nr:nuclease-related domain-containing protein [Planococcus massiliensis]CEG21974.1 Nuclease-related domain protein [Planococcus massiliensis]